MDPSSFQAGTEKHMGALEQWMAPLFAKFPHLPESARQTLAKIAPWLALIFGILGILAILSAGSIASSFFGFALLGVGMMQISMLISLLAGLIASVLDILAYKPLTARKKKGWNLLFYATVLTTVATILNLLFGYGSIGSLVGSLIGFWLLFEARGLYQ